MARQQLMLEVDQRVVDPDRIPEGGFISYTASLIIQGRHRFFTLSMPSDVLAETCIVARRNENPIDGFNRLLDKRRALEIADYIDDGLGTIPSSIVLSAQVEAELRYDGRKRTLSFRNNQRAFLILDGQHRVFGFHLARARLRVPVVIYNNLTKADEVQLFIDINTKQRPVPNELLLDIKKLAESETDVEALLRMAFDHFNSDPDSALLGLLSPSERRRGKISRVTFNVALKAVWYAFQGSDAAEVYKVLNAYLQVWMRGLREREAEDNITNPTLFRAIMLLFPAVGERVADRNDGEYTSENFNDVLRPFFSRVKKSELQRPGASPIALYDEFRKHLQSSFSIGRSRAQ
jgi:DGQHR domain-containing protein